MLIKTRNRQHLISLPYKNYREIKELSTITNSSAIKIIHRGIMLGKLEAIAQSNGGYLLLKSDKDSDPIIIR